MSIDVSVGVLLDYNPNATTSPDQPFFDAYTQVFERLNQYLADTQQPQHHEPINDTDREDFHRSAKSGMSAFQDLAWTVHEHTSFDMTHIVDLSCNDAIYLPRHLETILKLPPTYTQDISVTAFGSAHQLYRSCKALMAILDIEQDISPMPGYDTLATRLDQQLRCSWPAELVEKARKQHVTYTANNQWPDGAGHCHIFHDACLHAIAHGMAIVIH